MASFLDTQRRALEALRARVQGAKNISDISRREFTSLLAGPAQSAIQNFRQVETELGQAIEGRDPKFKERQLRQEQQKLITDRPGRRQTILTAGANRGRTQQVGSILSGKIGAV